MAGTDSGVNGRVSGEYDALKVRHNGGVEDCSPARLDSGAAAGDWCPRNHHRSVVAKLVWTNGRVERMIRAMDVLID